MISKAELRNNVLAKRQIKNTNLFEILNKKYNEEVSRSNIIASYISFGTEPSTIEVNYQLQLLGKTIITPTSFDEYSFTPFNIETADFIIIPALGVTKFGDRLGRGGGWYDRVLPNKKKSAKVIAIVYESEIFEELPTESHDFKIDGFISI